MCTFARSFSLILLAVLCSVADAFGDGFIVVPPPERPTPIPRPVPVPEDHFAFAPLEVTFHRVDVTISEQTARTAVDQEFRNPTNQRLEGFYIFPIPKGAHIDSFSMDVDGKMTEAELLDADKARKIYEDIVRRAKDPALLEYAGRDAFKVRIFPIEPRGTKRVENVYIAEMWATRRVGWLLDEIRRHGESKEIKDEATALARRYGIVTPYTAYLIIEDEQRRDVPVAQRNMREMEGDQKAAERAAEDYDSLRREAAEESARSGDQAVFNVMSLQSLKYGRSGAAKKPAAEALAKSEATAEGGPAGYRSSTNYAQQVRVIQGRAFYQNGRVWNDSTAQARKDLRVEAVPFNSDEYFELLRKHPESAQWLALGRNVDVVIGKTLYQVRAN